MRFSGLTTFYLLAFSFFLYPQSAVCQNEQDAKRVKILFSAPQTAYDLAILNAQVAAAGVFIASNLNGRTSLVTTGTLKQFAADWQSFTYSPYPQDRLVIEFLNNPSVNIVIEDFRGDFSSDYNNFLSQNHSLKFQSSQSTGSHLQIASLQLMGQRQAEIKGKSLYENVFYNVNLQMNGTYSFNSDSTGSQYSSHLNLKGSITAEDLDIQINESQIGHIVSARRTNGRFSVVSSSERKVADSMQVGSDTYQLSNLVVRKVFKDGSPSEPEYWNSTSGMVIKNGTTIANVRALYELPYIKIKALFSQNEGIDLERWLITTTP